MPTTAASQTRVPRLVSVIIPARDAATTIGEQLAALARQDYTGDYEVVVTDNGSRDRTADIARSWTEQVPQLRIVSVARGQGAAFARNVGVAAASGDFLAFSDSDDLVTEGWLSALVGAAVDADMVGGPVELDALNDPVVQAWFGWRPFDDHLPATLGFLPGVIGCNCGVWRTAFEQVGGWNERYTPREDAELSWRAQLAGYRVAFAPGALVHYRLRSPLGVVWRKGYLDGQTQARLFREFGGRGMPRTDTRRAIRAWAGRARHLLELLGPRSRGRYVRVTAEHAGRLVGSVRYRTLYL